MSVQQPKETPPWANFVAGGAAGTLGATFTLPLEVIKTRLQTSRFKDASTRNIFGTRIYHTFVNLYKTEGIKGFFKGFLPTLTAVVPARAIHFGTYSYAKQVMIDRLHFPESHSTILFCAGVAGVTVATISSPIWLVKTRLQLQNKTDAEAYKSTWDCFKRVYQAEGIRGFYRGLVATYMGISESSLQFVLYESFKSKMKIRKFKMSNPSLEPSPEELRAIDLNSIETILTAGAAKVIASVATYPHEVVRTRMREYKNSVNTKYKKFWHSLLTIAREEGRSGLYGGMIVHLMRVVPNAAIMFWTFESVLSYLRPYFPNQKQ